MTQIKKYIDIMLDLETLGTKPGCKILSIGACTFNIPAFFVPSNFYGGVDIKLGNDTLVIDPVSEAWWNTQSKEARITAFSGSLSLKQVLENFNYWLESQSKWGELEIRIWGKGKDFDAPIIRAAYEVVGLFPNWKQENEMCFRAMYKDMAKQVPKPAFKGIAHNALADAKHQAEHADMIIKVLRREGSYEDKMIEYKEVAVYERRD